MATQARCTFSIQAWDEKTFTEGEDALKLTHASISKTFSGDLEGQGILLSMATANAPLVAVCVPAGGQRKSPARVIV